ncbi:exodeoxyribonuclease III [Alphaproteobacteria bacterium]|nr:exodeoxyribonuclease III [Alphaproteobacteria bacterium]
MRLATWNINSVRLRIGLVLDFLNENDIDVLCLQETKTEDQHFPAEALREAGWAHQAIRGEKSYNGVAIISRTPLSDVAHMNFVGKEDCRHISAVTDNGIRIHNFYIPAGGDVPDRDENPKFGHKLDFLAEMTAHFSANKPEKSVLVGDLNIAPLEQDVWSSKQLLKIISHTPIETDGLKKLIADGGWHDAVRAHFGPDEKIFSWWSYRSRDWTANNRGRRLDHVWVSNDLAESVQSAAIYPHLRSAEKPSDHVPITIDL